MRDCAAILLATTQGARKEGSLKKQTGGRSPAKSANEEKGSKRGKKARWVVAPGKEAPDPRKDGLASPKTGCGVPESAIIPGKSWRDSLIAWANDPLAPGPTESRVGRPSFVITEEIIQHAHDLASEGYRDVDIALAFGIAGRTLYDKCIEYPQLSLAIKAGRNKHLRSDLQHLNRMKSSQLGAVIFSMKAVHGFKEEQDADDAATSTSGNTSVVGERVRNTLRRIRK